MEVTAFLATPTAMADAPESWLVTPWLTPIIWPLLLDSPLADADEPEFGVPGFCGELLSPSLSSEL